MGPDIAAAHWRKYLKEKSHAGVAVEMPCCLHVAVSASLSVDYPSPSAGWTLALPVGGDPLSLERWND